MQYVLVVAVIIAIIIFAFISLLQLQQREIVKHQLTKEAITRTQMGFDYLQNKNIPYNTATILNLFDDFEDATTIIKKHWGVFDLAMVTSTLKNEFFQKIGLLGTANKKRNTLYLQEDNKALVLVGKTKIIGNVALPKQGVKRGNIAGTSYYGSELIYGNTRKSATTLPAFKNSQYLSGFFANYDDGSFNNIALEDGMKLHQSFSETSLLYEDSKSIVLSNMSLSGNILIVSKTQITVQSSAVLEDVILIAPKIIIESNVKGSFQAFASKNIDVKPNCLLRYPSALVLFDKEKSSTSRSQIKKENQITIAKNSVVKGVVVYHSENKRSNHRIQISIAESAIITGEVYCTQNLELKGTVFGTVYTHNFIVKKSGGVYLNHIYNGVINAQRIPNQFAGLQIHQASNAVAKWVD